ncbi:MAG: 30S ribosomal protein S17 [Erysipelotrichaceae bacterium]|jgi:small subunit ribosomal protein S17|nr:30S ribosomal protein S17 [Erysipelotrichaceae bacterium]
MENRVARPTFTGVVVSDKMDKTIVVLVQTHKKHVKYLKRVKYGKKYYAHDENNEAKVGDTVTIMGCRRLSATKRYRLVSIDLKAVESIKAAEAELLLEENEGVNAVEPEAEVKAEAGKEKKAE